MRRKRTYTPRRGTPVLERLAWNAAALAALAVMLLLLLSSLQWLDEVAPRPEPRRAPVAAAKIAREQPGSHPSRVAGVGRPSG
jgi:hypothetical protein